VGTHPLQTILEPERQSDYAWSYVQMYKHSSCLPSCPGLWPGCSMGMNSNHTVSVINDIYQKGYRNYDAEKAYEAMRNYALTDPAGDPAFRRIISNWVMWLLNTIVACGKKLPHLSR
jgi:putative alpha-1,2-mannosidase